MRHFQQLSNLVAAAALGIAFAVTMLDRPQTTAASAPTPTPAAAPELATDKLCDDRRSVQVSGAATINVTPDRVLIKLGVESNGTTTGEVQARNLMTSQSIIKAAKELGTAVKDISTDYYVVQPIYETHNALVIKGYRIDNTIAITLNDANKTSALLVAAFKAGANKVLDVQFYTSQLRKYRDEARALAMKAATEKGQALALAAGAQAGCVLSIGENSWSYYTGSWWWGSQQGLAAQNVVQNAPANGEQPAEDMPISLGKIAIRAEVNAHFSLH
jgi:uncharacterized protein